jgi:long-chain acyl-CoA synthetase
MERPWLKHYDPGVPQHLEYPHLPLYHLLDDSAAREPDRPCASFFGRRLSYRALKDASDRFAAALQRLGVAPGDRVGLLLPSAPSFIVAYYGALKVGAVVVALNPLANPHELTSHLRDSGAETLVTIPLFLTTVAELRQRAGLRRIIAARLADWMPFPLSLAMRLREWRQERAGRAAAPIDLATMIAQPPPPDWRPVPVDPDGLAVLLYSGGTTGVAKGIRLSHFACMANAHQIRAWGRLRPSDRIVAVLPLFHGYGMSANMNAQLLAGAEIVLVPRFEARDVLKTIQKRRPTFFTGVPTMFVAFSNLPDIDRYDLSSLEGIFVGAAPLTAAIKEEFERKTGGRMIEGYGLTEAVTAIMANPYKGTHKIGSIGIPFPDVDVKIVGLDDGHDLAPGELGQIVLRSPTLMQGYYNQPGASAEALKDGWLQTGDVGYMDEDGYFYITDRQKDLIIVGGFNVFPREIEEVLYQHPKVKEGTVIGVPDPYAGERIKVFAVLKEGESATEAELLAFFRERLTRYKVPSAVEFRKELPKSMIGKIMRRSLREEEQQTTARDALGKRA